MTKERTNAETVAATYWRQMRKGALREVEFKLSQFRTATPNTIAFWLAVHAALEKKLEAANQMVKERL